MFEDYGTYFFELTEKINKYDPVALLGDGYPSDEYEIEIKSIIIQLTYDMSLDQVYDLVANVFRHSFFDAVTVGCEEKYRQMAGDIHEWMRKNQRLRKN